MPSTPSEPLVLDPGPQPRRRSRPSCRCFLWLCLTLFCIISIYLGFLTLRTIVNLIKSPHSHQFQDLNILYSPNDVVKPLVDSNQTFDVVATVWLRQPIDTTLEGWHGAEGSKLLAEEAIYSDTIFRGLHLKDKNIRAAVNLSIPTEIFKRLDLWNYDLRASFALIPNPPSALEYAVSFSSWLPKYTTYPPMRIKSGEEDRTLTDDIIDSFGLLVPLLDFHPILSKCEGPSQTGVDKEEGDEDLWTEDDTSIRDKLYLEAGYKSTVGKRVLENHPYITTRTHVRVLDMTAINNRKIFEKYHRTLAIESCGQKKFGYPLWMACKKQFLENANRETRIKLRVPNALTGEETTEWAYTPYLDYSATESGPMDLKPVPVNREECPAHKEGSEASLPSVDENKEADVMNITWKITFSGRTPAKLMALNALQAPLQTHGRTAVGNFTEYTLKTNQDQHAFVSGIFGHSYEDSAHPRILFLLYIICFCTFLPEQILTFRYWFTRTSTVGISIVGTSLVITGMVMQYAIEVVLDNYDAEKSLGIMGWVFAAIFRLEFPFSLALIWMLKTITRAEFRRSPASYIPRLYFSDPTHAERTSQRVDARNPLRHIVLAYTGLAILYLGIDRYTAYFQPSEHTDLPAPNMFIAAVNILGILTHLPPIMLGRALQLLLNYRSKTFAGAYRLAACLNFVSSLTNTLSHIPGLFGHYEIQPRPPWFLLGELILISVTAWQALVYPPASELEEETNE